MAISPLWEISFLPLRAAFRPDSHLWTAIICDPLYLFQAARPPPFLPPALLAIGRAVEGLC